VPGRVRRAWTQSRCGDEEFEGFEPGSRGGRGEGIARSPKTALAAEDAPSALLRPRRYEGAGIEIRSGGRTWTTSRRRGVATSRTTPMHVLFRCTASDARVGSVRLRRWEERPASREIVPGKVEGRVCGAMWKEANAAEATGGACSLPSHVRGCHARTRARRPSERLRRPSFP